MLPLSIEKNLRFRSRCLQQIANQNVERVFGQTRQDRRRLSDHARNVLNRSGMNLKLRQLDHIEFQPASVALRIFAVSTTTSS
ncbi:hypothetical protein J2Y68_004302 [Paenarthrobacter nitroguajacolicus]|nr:hypothetical protein [Paenarthrobacter nitroguajacolicus]